MLFLPLGVQSVLSRTCITEPGNPKERATIKSCAKVCKDCGFKVETKSKLIKKAK